MVLDFLFLPVLFLIGLITSYQDFKEGKIKNKWIVLGLVFGLGVYLLLIIWALIVPYLSQVFAREFTFILPSYIFKVFINSTIAFFFGYLLWYFDFWSAGDAKLFLVFSLLLPLKYYWKSALPYFPSFALLINTFIPVLLFLMAQNLIYFLKSSSLSEISIAKLRDLWSSSLAKFKTNYLIYLKIFFGFFVIFINFLIIKTELVSFSGQTMLKGNFSSSVGWLTSLLMLLLVIVRKFLRKVFKKKWFLILSSLGLVFYLGSPYSHFSLLKLSDLLKTSFFFMVIFGIISKLASVIEESQKKDLPFAIWLTIGALITIIIKSSLLHLLMKFVG